MATLLSIGAFARAAGIPASALRFYDEIGLLSPAHVDPSNSYRYYDPTQQAQAHLLAELRSLDVPLEEMRTILQATPSERDSRLEHLARHTLRRAEHRAQRLRALTSTSSATTATITTDGPAWAATLRAITAFTGDHPLDGVMLTVTPTHLRCLATDRYRLADHHIPARATTSITRVLNNRHVQATAALLENTGPTSRITITDTLNVEGASIPLDSTDAFPDLATLADAYAQDAGHPVPVDDSWTHANTTAITVTVGTLPVRFTTRLLDDSTRALGNTNIQIAATTTNTPAVLTTPDTPNKRIILMPRTP